MPTPPPSPQAGVVQLQAGGLQPALQGQAAQPANVFPAAPIPPAGSGQAQVIYSQQNVQGSPQPHPNLFQDAVLEHAAAAIAATIPATVPQTASRQSTVDRAQFSALHTLSSSESSTASGSSGSSGDSQASLSASNPPAHPVYQSMGPHLNIPFDL